MADDFKDLKVPDDFSDLQFPEDIHAEQSKESALSKWINPIHERVSKAAEAAIREYFNQNLDPRIYLPTIGHAIAHPIDSGLAGPVSAANEIYQTLKGKESPLFQTGSDIGKGLVSGDPNITGKAIGDASAIGANVAVIGGNTSIVGAPIASKILRNSAESSYMDVLKPDKYEAYDAQDTAKTMADKRVMSSSMKSLMDTAKTGTEHYGPLVPQAYEQGNQPGIVPTSKAGAGSSAPVVSQANKMEVFKDLEDLRNRTAVIKRTGQVMEPEINDYINEKKAQLTAMQDPTTGDIPQEDLRQWRQILQQKAETSGGKYAPSQAPETKAFINNKLRNSIMNVLHRENPTGAAIDATYSFYSDLHKFTKNSNAEQIAGEHASAMRPGLNWAQTMIAGTPGPIKAVPKAILGFFDSVPWNTVSGAGKAAVADALANSDFTKVTRQLQLLKLGVPVDKDNK